MKKYSLTLLLMSIVLILTACSDSSSKLLDKANEVVSKLNTFVNSRTRLLDLATDEEIENEKLNKIINYIANKDEEALKAMFSKRALEETTDFSGNAKLLFEFFKGEFVSYKKSSGPTVYQSADNGKVVKEVDSYYYVETDKAKFYFLINDYQVDDVNSDNEGINMLLVVLAANRLDVYKEENEILFKDGDKISPPGIYLPIR